MKLVGGMMKLFSCHLLMPVESFEARDFAFKARDLVTAVSHRTDFRSLQVYAWLLIPPRSIG